MQLSNIQQELLKLYSVNISEEQLREIKVLLAKYFAGKAMDEADRIWEERGYSDKLMDKWLNDNNQ